MFDWQNPVYYSTALLFSTTTDEDIRIMLKNDIRKNGLREPITVTPDGQVLDGKLRLEIWLELFKEGETSMQTEPPWVICYEDDLDSFVMVKNMVRRHISLEQRQGIWREKRAQLMSNIMPERTNVETSLESLDVPVEKKPKKAVSRKKKKEEEPSPAPLISENLSEDLSEDSSESDDGYSMPKMSRYVRAESKASHGTSNAPPTLPPDAILVESTQIPSDEQNEPKIAPSAVISPENSDVVFDRDAEVNRNIMLLLSSGWLNTERGSPGTLVAEVEKILKKSGYDVSVELSEVLVLMAEHGFNEEEEESDEITTESFSESTTPQRVNSEHVSFDAKTLSDVDWSELDSQELEMLNKEVDGIPVVLLNHAAQNPSEINKESTANAVDAICKKLEAIGEGDYAVQSFTRCDLGALWLGIKKRHPNVRISWNNDRIGFSID